MDEKNYKDKMRQLAVSLWLHCVIIPCIFILIARLLWGGDLKIFLGVASFFSWIIIFGRLSIKKVMNLKKEKD